MGSDGCDCQVRKIMNAVRYPAHFRGLNILALRNVDCSPRSCPKTIREFRHVESFDKVGSGRWKLPIALEFGRDSLGRS